MYVALAYLSCSRRELFSNQELWDLASRENRKFAGSTSSLSGMLCQIYFLISGNKPVNLETLSQNFQRAVCELAIHSLQNLIDRLVQPTNFTPGQRMPPTVVFNHQNGTYAIDSHADTLSDKNILTWMVRPHGEHSPNDLSMFMAGYPS